VAHHGCGEAGDDQALQVVVAHPGGQHAAVARLGEGGADAQAHGLYAVAVEIEAREVFAEGLGDAVQAVRPCRVLEAHDFVLPVEAGDVVAAGKDHALDALLARGLVQVVHAHDVGGQYGVPGLFGGHAAQVHHGVHPGQQAVDRSGVLQPGGAHFLPGGLGTQVGDV